MKFPILGSLCLLAALTGCYDDKGNYDYKDLPKVILEMGEEDNTYFTVGDIIRLHPKIDRTHMGMDLAYTWTWQDEVIGTDSTLVYPIKEMPEETYSYLNFDVKDNQTGVTYRLQYTIMVSYKYDSSGFMLLSKKADGTNDVSLIIPNEYGDDYKPKNFRVVDPEGINHVVNPTNPLPADVFKMTEQFALVDQVERQEMFLTPNDIRFLYGSTFEADDEHLTDLFWDKTLPAGFTELKDALFMKWYNMLIDQGGHVYSRMKGNYRDFQVDYFLPDLVKAEGEDEPLTDVEIVPCYWGGLECAFLYERSKGRMLIVWDMQYDDFFGDGENDAYIVGKVQPLTSRLSTQNWPRETKERPYTKVEDVLANYELISAKMCHERGGSDLAREVVCLLKDDVGTPYLYTFGIERAYSAPQFSFLEDGNTREVAATWKKLDDGETARLCSDPNSIIETLIYTNDASGMKNAAILIANGKDLYVLNRAATNPAVRKLMSFDSDIAMMNADYYQSQYLGVALKDGSFAVVRMSADITVDGGEDALLWSTKQEKEPVNLGSPIHMIYRDDAGNYGLSWR